jgi:hypothetical protein
VKGSGRLQVQCGQTPSTTIRSNLESLVRQTPLAHIVFLSHEAGLDNRFPDTLYAVYAAGVVAGLGAKGLPAVYEPFRTKRT